jgi:NADPH:quinone reductase
MLAARVNAFGQPFELEELPDPSRSTGETLIRVEAAVVGHLDLGVAGGRFPLLPSPPYTPGSAGSGRVLDSDVFAQGTLVEIRGGGLGLIRDGTWATQVVVPDDGLRAHPPDADPFLIATFASSYTTAHVAVLEVGRLEVGERVVVTGASGAVGRLAVELAVEHGAGEVIGMVGAEQRRDAVPADAVATVGLEETIEALQTPADLLIDTIGGPVLPRLIEHVRPGGRASLVGYTKGEQVTFDLPRLLFFDVRLLPVNVMSWSQTDGEALEQAAHDALGRMSSDYPVISFPLARVREAADTLAGGTARGRVVLVPNEG